jgi:hypothetical protein
MGIFNLQLGNFVNAAVFHDVVVDEGVLTVELNLVYGRKRDAR